MQTRCIYCDEKYYKTSSLVDMYLSDDPLCTKCRKSLHLKRATIKIDDTMVKSFYEYDEVFRDILLQYKECYDEALKDVFLYPFINEIRFKYLGYVIVCIPSSKTKRKRRGFDHMMKMVECLKMPVIDALELKEDMSQADKSYAKRQMMIENIVLKKGVELPFKILVIDDVLTTGASIKGALKALGKDKKIKVLTVSYVKKRKH